MVPMPYINLLILVMRNQGSLRLILNTRLWDQMVIKRANRKSLCFTATDQEDHSVQVFLIQVSKREKPQPNPHFIQDCEDLLRLWFQQMAFDALSGCSAQLLHGFYYEMSQKVPSLGISKKRCEDGIWPQGGHFQTVVHLPLMEWISFQSYAATAVSYRSNTIFYTGSQIFVNYFGTRQQLSAMVLDTVLAVIHPVQDLHFSVEENIDFAMSPYVRQQSWESRFSLARAGKLRMEVWWT